ncbi:hypothetical protein [uncultured Methanobrevibacter sp.]|uniref:hypothetical protein n=1 Tax=uncultured Methanobrevibacter sp. TaxID=253161 RepID=UPI00262EB6DF|nr:hypothetical protein [uncultured Methanobrevibacter sp.]
MIRLKNIKQVIYDTNVIIYYCFPKGRYNIKQHTNPAEMLTNFLFNQNSIIIVPDFIINEIMKKGIYEIIEDYFSEIEQHQKLRLYTKIKRNLERLKQSTQFVVEEYTPSTALIDLINSAYDGFNQLPNINQYLNLKKTDSLNPSIEDKMLILFSRQKKSPIVSHDRDLTFFRDELINMNLVTEIIDFNSISSIAI